MSLNSIEILGFRGFKRRALLRFAIPTGELGSGLSIIVGPNNSGKSSILECLRAREGHKSPSYSMGSRNSSVDEISIIYNFTDRVEKIESISKGSSETKRVEYNKDEKIYVVPSRRSFQPYFNRGVQNRDQYLNATNFNGKRDLVVSNFEYRLFKILENPSEFNSLLAKVLGFNPEWTIDQSDQGQYFLKFFNGDHSHSSEGLGEGIVSIFAIIDSLYDSEEGSMIVVDEPELSLHPSLQKRLLEVILDYARTRQIVIATHSPYFVDLFSIKNGGVMSRVVSDNEGSKIYQLSDKGIESINKLVTVNINNPHLFGTTAKELFFLEDDIILTEGQEDVVLYPIVADQLKTRFSGSFFGWGAGGASNIQYLCWILKDLGYKRVVGLLDGDKIDVSSSLALEFKDYYFNYIPADDIRDKPARNAVTKKEGLLDSERNVKTEHKEKVMNLVVEVNEYFAK